MELANLFQQPQVVAQKAPSIDAITSQYIKDNEGYNPEIYKDTKKIPTTGYGFNLNAEHIKKYIPKDVLSGKRALTQPESDDIFNKVYIQSVNDAKTFVSPAVFEKLTNNQKQALVDMSYNMGLTRLNKFSNLRKALYEGNSKDASIQVLEGKTKGSLSKYALDVPERARKNAKLMLK